jgi:hypothetical protein
MIVGCVSALLQGSQAMAQQTPPSITRDATLKSTHAVPVSRVRDVISITCGGTHDTGIDSGLGSGRAILPAALHDALCTTLYRQIKDKVPGYAYRRMPDLSAAPTRAGDVRVRLVVQHPAEKGAEGMARRIALHLEWYVADAQTPQRGPVLEVAPAAQTVPGLSNAVTTLLRMTPLLSKKAGFNARMRP